VKSKILSVALLLTLSFGVAAPLFSAPAAHAAVVAAPAASHSTGLFTKAKFVLHIGAAYWAFHRYVWKPYQAHELGLNYKGNTIKAGLALAFAYHELKSAYGDTKKDAGLAKLTAPIQALASGFGNLGAKLKGGTATDADLKSVSGMPGLMGKLNKAGQDAGVVDSKGFQDTKPFIPVPGL